MQPAYKIGVCIILITFWLHHINLFLQITMQEGIFHIHLMQRPSLCSSHSNYCSHGCHPCNWAESFLIVNSICLRKTFGNQSCLVPANRPISIVLYFVNPLAANSLLIMRQRHQIPSVVCIQGSHLFIHSCFPIFMPCCILKTCGLWLL